MIPRAGFVGAVEFTNEDIAKSPRRYLLYLVILPFLYKKWSVAHVEPSFS
jgi:hypothetical protein